jgi:hypothetical protein
MASRSTPNNGRSSKSTDVRRTLFRSLTRSTPSTDLSSAPSTSNLGGLGEGDEFGGNSVVVKKSDGSYDIDAPLAMHEHLQIKDMERECEFAVRFRPDKVC